jgi:Ca2+/H+ antiporter
VALRLKPENALSLLLIFIPVAVLAEWAFHASATVVFITSAIAIIPLAGLMGRQPFLATARLSTRNIVDRTWRWRYVLLAL